MLCKCWLLTLEPLFFLPEITCQEANQCVKQVSELCFQPWALAPHVPWPAWETTQLGPHRVSICPTHWETALHWHVCRPIQRQFPISCQGLSFRFYFLKEEWKSGDYIYIYIYSFCFHEEIYNTSARKYKNAVPYNSPRSGKYSKIL